MLASFASERSDFEVARLLLEAGAKKEYSDHDGRTALMLASLAGNWKIASLLLDAGAETHAADRYASTALMLASESGHFEVVRLLMNAGADACCDPEGMTALTHASRRDSCEVAHLQHESDPEEDSRDSGGPGWTALVYASLSDAWRSHICCCRH